MRSKKFWISNFCFLIAAATFAIAPLQNATAAEKNDATAMSSPVGLWKTIDDTSHQPRSIVKVWEENGQVFGKITKIYFKPGESEKDLCTKCTGEDKDKPILGMIILRGFQLEEGMWTGGKILDPESGNLYNAKLRLKDDGQSLDVRGYIGIPLIGRTQLWTRVSPKDI